MVIDRCDLPEEFCVNNYEFFQGIPTKVLTDHDIIDIGGREIEVLHTPGHSPGHLCFWESRRGYLFTGDLVYKDILFAYYPSTDPEAYLNSDVYKRQAIHKAILHLSFSLACLIFMFM